MNNPLPPEPVKVQSKDKEPAPTTVRPSKTEKKKTKTSRPLTIKTNRPALPPLYKRAWRYFWSTLRWVCGGGELRTQAEIDHIFDLCSRCPFSVQKNDDLLCSECGCLCSTKKNGLTNKIARRNEHCPLKPRW